MSFARFLNGALRYKNEIKPKMMKELAEINQNPKPVAVMYSCMDHRIATTVLTQSNPGDMFIVRNAGNMIENSDQQSPGTVTAAAGQLEMACLVANVKHIVVCGHSDCKAVRGLLAMKGDRPVDTNSPLKMWLKKVGTDSLDAFRTLEYPGAKKPFELHLDHPKTTLRAYIDTKLEPHDKLSQVNTLMQFKHISSYKFLHERLDSGLTKMAAMWFDVHTGDVLMFSEKKEKFVEISDETFGTLLQEHFNEE